MIITCPACSTRYLMNSSAIHPAGQIVRCSGCGHSWKQYPLDLPSDSSDMDSSFMPSTEHTLESDGFASHPASLSTQTPYHSSFSASGYATSGYTPEETGTVHKPSASSIRTMGWLLVLFILGVIGTCGYLFKSEIAQRLPATYRFNLDQNSQFNFLSPVAEQKTDNGRPILVVTGRVMNMTTEELPLPDVKMTLLNSTKAIVGSQVVKSFRAFPVERLAGSQTINFEIKADTPPAEALDLQLEFVSPPQPASLSLDKQDPVVEKKAPVIEEIPPAPMADQNLQNPAANIEPLIQEPQSSSDNKPLP